MDLIKNYIKRTSVPKSLTIFSEIDDNENHIILGQSKSGKAYALEIHANEYSNYAQEVRKNYNNLSMEYRKRLMLLSDEEILNLSYELLYVSMLLIRTFSHEYLNTRKTNNELIFHISEISDDIHVIPGYLKEGDIFSLREVLVHIVIFLDVSLENFNIFSHTLAQLKKSYPKVFCAQ